MSPELQPNELPAELAAFLQDQPLVCLTHATDQGTVFVIKAPAAEIERLRGRVPIELRHELYDHPSAPVLRMVLTFFDQPDRPLALETFINVDDPQQRADFAAMAEQEEVGLLFYDDALSHRLTKSRRAPGRAAVTMVLTRAEALRRAIPSDRYDFDRAKDEVIRSTHL